MYQLLSFFHSFVVRKLRVDLPQRANHPLVSHVHLLLQGTSSGPPSRRGHRCSMYESVASFVHRTQEALLWAGPYDTGVIGVAGGSGGGGG